MDIAGSLGCGIGYGYLHRIPIRALPDDKSLIGSATMPSVGSATAIPYVPPLANTFASTNVNAVPMVPNTGKSDAEIVFSGVANMNLGNQHATANLASLPISNEQIQQQQLPTNETISNVHFQSPTEQPPILIASSLYQQQAPQNPPIFGTVSPTSIPSLNESFNIPPANIQNSAQTSIYQANQLQSMNA